MKNNITPKYLWKHSTLYILYLFPMIVDISLNVHLVIPIGKAEHKKNMLSWSIYDFNFDGRKKKDP